MENNKEITFDIGESNGKREISISPNSIEQSKQGNLEKVGDILIGTTIETYDKAMNKVLEVAPDNVRAIHGLKITSVTVSVDYAMNLIEAKQRYGDEGVRTKIIAATQTGVGALISAAGGAAGGAIGTVINPGMGTVGGAIGGSVTLGYQYDNREIAGKTTKQWIGDGLDIILPGKGGGESKIPTIDSQDLLKKSLFEEFEPVIKIGGLEFPSPQRTPAESIYDRPLCPDLESSPSQSSWFEQWKPSLFQEWKPNLDFGFFKQQRDPLHQQQIDLISGYRPLYLDSPLFKNPKSILEDINPFNSIEDPIWLYTKKEEGNPMDGWKMREDLKREVSACANSFLCVESSSSLIDKIAKKYDVSEFTKMSLESEIEKIDIGGILSSVLKKGVVGAWLHPLINELKYAASHVSPRFCRMCR